VIGLTDRKPLEDFLRVLVVPALCVLYFLRVSKRVCLEVVVLSRLCVLKVLSISKRVALDLCLFLGSLAVLILHGVLLSHYGVPINVHKTV
jgi:hypothetical protein